MDSTEILRKLFDGHPYPNQPIEMTLKDNTNFLFIHSLTTAHYLRGDGYVDSKDKLILDIGCGSGCGALALAIANPDAKIVGIDLSPKSIEVARERMKFHGFTNSEFHAIALEEVSSLGMQFDYINCDEILYLLPEPTQGLGIMASVLSPQGIIRTNLHSLYGRREVFRAQTLSHFLGLMDGEIGDWECEVLREFMGTLKDGVNIKPLWQSLGDKNEAIRMNFLFASDKGYTVPEMSAMIEANELELISMVNWRQWSLEDLFEPSKSLPESVEMILADATPIQRLHLFELLHPVHRLLDFWCGHQNREVLKHQPINLLEISYSDRKIWENYTLYLHPQLRIEKFKQGLEEAIARSLPFPITQFVSCTSLQPINLFSPATICLWLLWQQPRSISEVVKYWLRIKPVNHLTLAALDESEAFREIHQALIQLETLLVVLIDA